MMRIPFDLAETLAAVVDEGTLDAAARRLNVTPSAVSQRIKALEEHVGQVCLVRSKPARITAAGEAVVRLARQLALLERETADAIGSGEGSGTRDRVSMALAVNADSLGTWFLEPLARLALRHPVVFDLHRDDQDFTAGLLESGTVIAAVTSRARPVAGCRVVPLGVMRYEAVATPAYVDRWFPDGPTPEALARAVLVDYDRRDDLQTRWLAHRGVDARPPRHYVPASGDFARAVALGLGWGLLPTFQAAGGLTGGSLVRLDDAGADVPLYWQQWNLHSALLRAVSAEVVAEARNVLGQRPAGAPPHGVAR